MKNVFHLSCGLMLFSALSVSADAARDDMINGCLAGGHIVNSAVGLASRGVPLNTAIDFVSNDLESAGWIMTTSAQQLILVSVDLGFQMYEDGHSSVEAKEIFLENCLSTIPR